MIRGYVHKGLARLRSKGDSRGIDTKLLRRLVTRLDVINAAMSLEQMNRTGWELHELKGKRAGTWSIRVNGPWWITFRWDSENMDAYEVNLEQYHDMKIKR